MKCPTKAQVQKASRQSQTAHKLLKELFPDAFDYIKPGQIYSWGTDSDGGCCLIIYHSESFTHLSAINFTEGYAYLSKLPNKTSKADLNERLSKLHNCDPKLLHNCYRGNIRGPSYFKSWCTK